MYWSKVKIWIKCLFKIWVVLSITIPFLHLGLECAKGCDITKFNELILSLFMKLADSQVLAIPISILFSVLVYFKKRENEDKD